MHGKIGDAEFHATNATPEIGNDSGFTPECESNPYEWFPAAARDLLGDKDTGLLLHLESGFPLSSCYAYVKKEQPRAVPDNLIRKLIHSDHGEPWHRAYMHGCKAQWWVKQQTERRLAELARSIFAELRNELEGAGNGSKALRQMDTGAG